MQRNDTNLRHKHTIHESCMARAIHESRKRRARTPNGARRHDLHVCRYVCLRVMIRVFVGQHTLCVSCRVWLDSTLIARAVWLQTNKRTAT